MTPNRWHPLTEREQERLIWVDVENAQDMAPWTPDSWGFRLKKTHVWITDYGADGTLDYGTQETFRVRTMDGNRLGLLRPEDDEEPNVPPGTMTVTAELEYDGTRYTVTTTYRDATDAGIIYTWTDGNWGCDCNRSLFIQDVTEGEFPMMDCGETIRLVSLSVDGRPLPL